MDIIYRPITFCPSHFSQFFRLSFSPSLLFSLSLSYFSQKREKRERERNRNGTEWISKRLKTWLKWNFHAWNIFGSKKFLPKTDFEEKFRKKWNFFDLNVIYNFTVVFSSLFFLFFLLLKREREGERNLWLRIKSVIFSYSWGKEKDNNRISFCNPKNVLFPKMLSHNHHFLLPDQITENQTSQKKMVERRERDRCRKKERIFERKRERNHKKVKIYTNEMAGNRLIGWFDNMEKDADGWGWWWGWSSRYLCSLLSLFPLSFQSPSKSLWKDADKRRNRIESVEQGKGWNVR